jgi:hypothetical protein
MTKPLYLTLFLLAILAAGASAQTPKDSIIRNIRQVFQRINHDSTLRGVRLEAEEFLEEAPDNGGELTGYFKGDTLKKMIFYVGPSYGLIEQQYYFDQGKIVFIYDTEKDFPATSTGELDVTKPHLVFEGRYYFDQGKLIEKILKGKKKFDIPIDAEYIADLLSSLPKYKKLLSARLR